MSLKIQDTVFMKDTSETKVEFIRVYETPEAVIVWEYDSICPNGEVILGGVIGFGNEWSTGLVTDSLIVQSSGTYALTSFNVEYPACRSMSDSLVIHVKPLPVSDFTYQTSDTSHLVKFQNISQYADSYHWNFGDGASSSLISPEHSYSQNGMYDMYLVAINRCGSDTTEAAIDLRYVSAQELMASFGVSVYPNPSRGLFHIDFSAPVSEANIWVYDASGKVIHNQSVSQVSSTSVQIDGVAGFYFIEVRTSEKVMRFKVIKTE